MRWAKFFKHAVAIENGHRGIKTEIVTKVVPVRAVDLSIGPFCTEFRCTQLCDEDIFRDQGQLLGPKTRLRDINTETVTKMVPVRAVDLSIGSLDHSAQNFGANVFVTTPLLEKSDIRVIRVGNSAIGVGRSSVFLHAVAIAFLHAVDVVFYTCGWPPPHVLKTSR